MTDLLLQQIQQAGYTVKSKSHRTHLLMQECRLIDLHYGSYDSAVAVFHCIVFNPTTEEPPPENGVERSRHARKRCKQRHKFKMSKRQYKQLCKRIEEGGKGVERLRQASRSTRSIWAVECAGHLIPVVYDEKDKVVVTVLPKRELCR